MFTLIKDNVERIVSDECARDIFIKEGFNVLEIKKESKLNKLTVEQLQSLATEKGLEFDAKTKKADLIALIESVEDGE